MRITLRDAHYAHLDRRVVGSFMTMTSVMSPYLVKYSLRLSETIRQQRLLIAHDDEVVMPKYRIFD